MIIGLTGGIASGKTTVSNYLKTKGYRVYDADIIAREIFEKREVEKEIIKEFGSSILSINNEIQKIDRKKLKKIVFEDENKLKILNNIIHPKVFKFYENIKKINKKEIIIFDVPLLFESGIDSLCDINILISAEEEIRIKRVMKRDNIEKKLAEKIIKSQMSENEKINKADIVIKNNEDIESLIKKIERFCENL
ncbi:MAG: dephospho-CoA kinase [Fusobacterium sp.]|nr:dephospho-CoA kinase [Fusobacterium sp.]